MPAGAQTIATIDIDTSVTVPVQPGFGGVNDEVSTPIEYWDYRFNTLAAKLNYGWVRFPGGITGAAYNWKSGQLDESKVMQFGADTVSGLLLRESVKWLAGKGGGKLVDAASRANLLNASLIVCVNGFTDSKDSVGQMAAYAKANGVRVAVWELSNEPYNYAQFFPTATAYLIAMRPYYDAIKTADPSAVVAIFADDPGRSGNPDSPWDKAIAAHPDKYWDAVAYHYYPPKSNGAFANWMADENGVLATKTDAYVTGRLAPMNPPGTKFLVSEFNPSLGSAAGTSSDSLTNGTLYGGIYAAEFVMRMATVPSVIRVGPHSIASFGGVMSTNEHYSDVTAAANAGTSIDTTTLEFGFYTAAQAQGLGILYGALNHAVRSNRTTVTGGATVLATGTPQGRIPALYALAFTNAQGGLSLVVTNKSATPHQVTVRVNGAAAGGSFPLQFVTGSDGSLTNSGAHPNTVTVQTGSSVNPIAVPPYSVLRADITSPPVATVVNSASYAPDLAAPQQLVTAFGSGFASQTITAPSQPLPVTLGDTTISIADSAGTVRMAPLYYVSPSQASFLIPDGVATGAASAKVIRSGATVLAGAFHVEAVSPGIYSANGNGAGVAAATALRAGGGATQALPVFTCQTGIALSCLSTPLALGASADTVYVTLYGSGIRAAKSVQVYVAGQLVPVAFSGAQTQYAGLDQINITLPRALASTGEASVYLVADGKRSNIVTLNIR